MAAPLWNFGTTKLRLTRNVTKDHIFVSRNVSIQYLAAFQQYWHNSKINVWKQIFWQKWPKIRKKSGFFSFNHLCWLNWYYTQHNRSQDKKEVYFLITSKFDSFFFQNLPRLQNIRIIFGFAFSLMKNSLTYQIS